MHRFATTILQRTFSRHPAIALQTVQQGHKRWFFDAEKRSDLGLGQRTGRHGQMQQGPPLSLAQTHRLQPLVQFQPPGTGGAMQERPE